MLLSETSHKRYNALSGEWVLVSPHRSKRPWQGKMETPQDDKRPSFDPQCYLCPGNKRASGEINPHYTGAYSFINDFSALLMDEVEQKESNEKNLLIAKNARGVCRVICFSPRHDLTLAELNRDELFTVIQIWCEEYETLSKMKWVKHIQIFENKGEIMGCSNPHPHGQIWAEDNLPQEILKELHQQKSYFEKNKRSLLQDYLELELDKQERIVIENEHFAALVPYWATWPFETMIISKRHVQNILQFNLEEKKSLIDVLHRLTIKYDNLFSTSFPYSQGIHQSPVNDGDHQEWHWHMHFYPPLLRSASVKKFMVGYEMLANPQRDITPEAAAKRLKELSDIHFKRS